MFGLSTNSDLNESEKIMYSYVDGMIFNLKEYFDKTTLRTDKLMKEYVNQQNTSVHNALLENIKRLEQKITDITANPLTTKPLNKSKTGKNVKRFKNKKALKHVEKIKV